MKDLRDARTRFSSGDEVAGKQPKEDLFQTPSPKYMASLFQARIHWSCLESKQAPLTCCYGAARRGANSRESVAFEFLSNLPGFGDNYTRTTSFQPQVSAPKLATSDLFRIEIVKRDFSIESDPDEN